jgi:alpha-tubulin suppressor-like RCC1 family protein
MRRIGLCVATAFVLSATAPVGASASSEVVGWGLNNGGQLGIGTREGPEECDFSACSRPPVALSSLSDVTAISAGGGFSLALLQNGRVMAWGTADLGDGITPERGSDVPFPVNGLSRVAAISAGSNDALALLQNGTVVAWGTNAQGQLGQGTTMGPETCSEDRFSCSRNPVPVPGLRGVVAIAAGNQFNLALLKNGTVMAWGRNFQGDLGDGTTT